MSHEHERAIIHLDAPSPMRSSSQPGNYPGLVIISLFGLAPNGVYNSYKLLPAERCALTAPFHPYRKTSAVFFLLHFPSGYPALSLTGILTNEVLGLSSIQQIVQRSTVYLIRTIHSTPLSVSGQLKFKCTCSSKTVAFILRNLI